MKGRRVSTLTSYNFCISNLILEPELIISVIHNCSLDVTIFSPIQRPKSYLKLEVSTIVLKSVPLVHNCTKVV